jgi:hypothetical protein
VASDSGLNCLNCGIGYWFEDVVFGVLMEYMVAVCAASVNGGGGDRWWRINK